MRITLSPYIFLTAFLGSVFLLQGCDNNQTLLDPFPFFSAGESRFWEDCTQGASQSAQHTAPPQTSTSVCAYPNPVTSGQVFTVNFYVPASVRVKIAIFNDKGRRIREIFNAVVTGSSSATWDLTDSKNVKVPPGSYRAILMAGDFESQGDILVK
ncbi:MAG: hypothetical protein QME66_06410 [Candidatus Eisenbacteria bacterium]|nr:hypothetical protein [Candidatus Eisenbacteria bacterium]